MKYVDEPTQYMNVDLEIGHRRSVDPLVSELGSVLFELYRGRELDDLDRVHYQISNSRLGHDPSATIRALVRALSRLGPAAQRCWRSARIRDFNIGIQAGLKPHSVELPIERPVVQSIAELGARIVVTVYAPPTKAELARARRLAAKSGR
ncbi:MAG: hypothetical protein ACTHU0_30170 [Kofleriaceae bacterium]